MAERVESAERAATNPDPEELGELRNPAPWRGTFAGPFSSVRLAAQRLGRSWRLLLAVELGMLIAVALLATAPFYSDIVASAQLQNTLTTAAPTDRNIQLDVTIPWLYSPGADPSARLTAIDQLVASDAQNAIGSFTGGSSEYAQTTVPFSITRIDGKAVTKDVGGYCENVFVYQACMDSQVLPMAFDYATASAHMKLVAGRLPQPTTGNAPPEVLVTTAMGVKSGATLHVINYNAAKKDTFGFDAKVVGVWTPKDPNDPFWNGLGFETVIVPNLSNPSPPQYPVLFSREAMVNAFSTETSIGPQVGMGLHYIYFVNSGGITVGQAPAVQSDLTLLRRSLDTDVPGTYGAQAVGVATSLDKLLASVMSLLGAQTQPLYSVDAQLVALALLFIFVMSGLLIESQSGEIATLKSRGASTLQVLLAYLSQGVLLAAVALLAGMVVAGGLALTLVRFFVPLAHAVSAQLTPAYVARSISLRDALEPASIGAGLGVLALALATWQAARMDALAFRLEQGRSERVPFWKRYYLDLGLALLCIAGYTELVTFGGLTTRLAASAAGATSNGPATGGQADLIQLLAPTLMLLAGALILQRLLPLVVRLGAWLTARGRGATGMLAFAQVTRASGAFSRLTLLLTLAVGLGLFALTFQTSLAASAHDNAYYLTGADQRVSIKPQSEGTQSTLGFATRFARMPGVESVSPLFRGVALSLPNQGGENIDVLGVDPATFAQTADWRSDYASQSLPALMSILARARHGAAVGQSDTPIVALVDQSFANIFALRVGDQFQLVPQFQGQSNTSTNAYFEVGAIVDNFPTVYDEFGTGAIVVDETDYLTMLANPNLAAYTVNGPNEFLLRASPDAHLAAERTRALADPNFFVEQTWDARQLTVVYRADPLSAGMSGLLLLGALIAALLALVGVITQAAIAARQRQTQFAILRTLGLSEGALTRMLLTEQALVYLLGALGGVVIGALLSVASLPFLGFNTSTYQPPVLGVPSSQLAVNLSGSLAFLLALCVIFLVALVIAGLVARSTGLGRALRVGED
ncbi:MAG TPA: FtsX-like permease family protein [Ktedonobacterales bacterium]